MYEYVYIFVSMHLCIYKVSYLTVQNIIMKNILSDILLYFYSREFTANLASYLKFVVTAL